MPDEVTQTEKKRYRAEANATDAEKKEVGGEKTLKIENYLFQSDADCQSLANSILARLKTRKKYFEAKVEFCAVPVEPGDTVGIEEYVTDSKSIWHHGLVRQVKISVTPMGQVLTLVLED